MSSGIEAHSRLYIVLLGTVALVAGGLAFFSDSASLGLAAAVVGLYVLHLYSIQVMQQQWKTLQGLERLVGEIGISEPAAERGPPDRSPGGGEGSPTAERSGAADDGADDTVQREFGLGTVAIVKGAMSPEEVARVMAEERRDPGRTFGDHAVRLGHLTETRLEDLLQVQRRGRYSTGAIREARRRIRAYRRSVDPGAPGD